MKTFLKWLVLAPLGVLLLAFAIANREPVRVVLDPLPGDSEFQIAAPLFLILFLATGLGVLAGGFATWVSQGRHRTAARHARSDIDRLRNEADNLRAQLAVRAGTALERTRDAA
ncbi:MAG: hypothetical protein JWN07_1603 [Hyphomicrobiales bacterium]|nr:hypothetical protein [Hyphomicrobiales bacterium]